MTDTKKHHRSASVVMIKPLHDKKSFMADRITIHNILKDNFCSFNIKYQTNQQT